MLVLVDGLLFSGSLGSSLSLALLNFTDGFFSKSLLFFGTSILKLLDVIESDTFDGSLLSEDFLLFVLASVGLL